jgi:tetratricopeptide (TPR) repeat protein
MKQHILLPLVVLFLFTISQVRATDNNPDSLINAALEAEDRGELEKAIELHKAVLTLQPKNSKSLNSIAGLYGVLGKYQDEIQWANKAILADPNNYRAFVNLGNAYAYLGDYGKAKGAYDTATTVNPKSALGFYSLGVLSESMKDRKKAESYYLKATQVESGFENSYLNLGALYANQGKFNEAISALNTVLKINPSANDARQMLEQIEKEIAKPK